MQTKSKPKKRGTARAAKGRAGLSAQQTIPYIAMHPDGVCQLPGGVYTKTVEYEDINYSVASTEDQTAIFGGWSSFLNTNRNLVIPQLLRQLPAVPAFLYQPPLP